MANQKQIIENIENNDIKFVVSALEMGMTNMAGAVALLAEKHELSDEEAIQSINEYLNK